jgi:tetratricopeptide (TPR) repeat protein
MMRRKKPSPRSSLSFAALLLLAACAPSGGKITDGHDYWSPADPPGAAYVLDATIVVEGDAAFVNGAGTIALTNTAKRPLSVMALEWAVKPGSVFAASVAGKPLDILNGGRNMPDATPLLLALPEPVGPGGRIRLDVRFTHRASVTNGQIHLGQWYPRLWREGRAARDSFRVKLSPPAGFAVAASGRLDPATGEYVNDCVTSHFGIFLSNAMSVERREAGGVEILALFTEKGRAGARFCLDAAADIVPFYKDWLGRYPHRSLVILPGGTQPMGGYPYASGLVVIHGLETFDPSKDPKDKEWWTWITAHEIGHQYWGESGMSADVPGNYTESWLMIGLGICADKEYMLRRGHGWDRHRGFLDRYLAGVKAGNDTTVDAPASLVKTQKYDRNNVLIHGKGFAVLSALETVLGAEEFDRLYRRAVREYAGRRLGWRDFQRLAEDESGQGLDWFFEDWVRTNRILEVRVLSQGSVPSGEGFASEVRVEYGLDSVRMPVPVRAEFEDGTVRTATTDRLARTNVLRFTSRSPLARAVLDPDRRLGLVEEAPPRSAAEIETAVGELDWTGTGEAALAYFRMPGTAAVTTPRVWFKLGLLLFDGGFYAESLDAFRKCRDVSASEGDLFGALVWMGHLSDLLGKRADAVACYAEALKYDTGRTLQHDQYGMRLDRSWVERRLATPFQWSR